MELTAGIILLVLVAYFAVLMGISFWTGKKGDNTTFFTGERKSPWYLVAFGMIGASLSGVTFISIPGWVGTVGADGKMVAGSQFSYMQMVFGYLVGYAFIAMVLMPLYYKLNLTSIYTYLAERFGSTSHKTGALFFLISRVVGASFRLYLVAIVLQRYVMEPLFPWMRFEMTVGLTIVLIWLYTFRGGIKTVVYTDTLQTLFMITAVVLSFFFVGQALDWTLPQAVREIANSQYSQIFFFEGGWTDSKNFFKSFLAGAAIATVMTGLDQDMMQKNLTCKNLKEGQKNILGFSLTLVVVNLVFLALGAMLYLYVEQTGMIYPTKMVGDVAKPASDLLFPEIALNHLPVIAGLVFILGLIAAAYSSADSALTSLTTSFCVDFLGMDKKTPDETRGKRIRFWVHIGFSVLLFVVIVIFERINDDSVIAQLFTIAGYTYGPLLGLYGFGLFTKRKIKDKAALWVCLLSPVITYLINISTKADFCYHFAFVSDAFSDKVFYFTQWLYQGYTFGFELLIMNGLITALGLFLISRKK